MTGPEHYREAEASLALADDPQTDPQDGAYYVASAQVHATLALAAATAMSGDWRAWNDVTGTCEPKTADSTRGTI